MSLTNAQQGEVRAQVARFLAQSQSFRAMAPADQAAIAEDTAKVVQALAAPGSTRSGDPYALGQANGTESNKNAAELIKRSTRGQEKIGDVIGAGVTQAARMIREINFPEFVKNLVEGTFHAIVKSSIEQMKAYAEMVRSVSMSLNDFKDKNTTENEARDHLVSKYPRHLTIKIVDNRPQVVAREDSLDTLPDFKELGILDQISDLDDETIEGKLVPAARDDLARGRQQLLATVILMGINRIIVTDGRINAKIRFQFSAKENRTLTAQAYDYEHMGYKTSSEVQQDEQGASSRGWWYRSTGENYVSTMSRTDTSEPDVRVTSDINMTSDAAIQASGQIMGEVSINFKSESFPLEKMVSTDQLLRLQAAQGPGHGAPPAGAAPAAGAPAAPATSAPAAAPAAPAPARV